MKASPFVYHRAHSAEEAVTLLAEHAGEAKVLAGGQSLIPMLNLRVAQPARLIDIGRCADLARLSIVDGVLRSGTMVRHARFERAEEPELAGCQALSEAARHIGHAPIRTRGTIGGSLAHADSSSEWCLMTLALDARMRVESVRGERVVDAQDFFHGFFTTALDEDELLTSIDLPSDTRGVALAEHARRQGDFAIVASATRLQTDERLRVTAARIAIGGVAGRPIRIGEGEQVLQGVDLTDLDAAEQAVDEAAHLCAASVEVGDDAHASAEYRRRLTALMVRRALSQAIQDWRTTGAS